MGRDEILKKAMHHVDCEVGDAIGMAIDAAVAAQKERDAKIAEECRMGGASTGDENADAAWDAACEWVAKKIREGK